MEGGREERKIPHRIGMSWRPDLLPLT
jgi:hypothetical protein